MFAFLPQLMPLILLLTLLPLNIDSASAQDLPGGASIIFIQHPRNPSVHPKTEHSGTQQKSGPTSGPTSGQDAPHMDAVEDALALGNSARETKPPRYKDSEKAYKLAAKLNPKDPRPYIGLANIWYDQKHYEEAAQMYRRAALLSTSIKTTRGPDLNKRSGRGGLPSAMATAVRPSRPARVNPVTETGVQTGELHAYLGNALLQRKKFSEAEIELKNATLEDPDNAEWQAFLGYSLFKQKRYAEASQALKAAVILAPENTRYKEILKESESREKR